jgi:hypothetical protein
MRKIDQIWLDLENDNSISESGGLRLYSGTSRSDIFAAIRGLEKNRGIAIPISITIDLSIHNNLEDIQLELIPDPSRKDRNLLLLKLINFSHIEIFSVLCEDLIETISSIIEESEILRIFFNRLENWKSLFEKASAEGLTPEEQRGLYGELFLLRKFLSSSSDSLKVINSWLGPLKANKDFQYSDWAIEVKTSYGNSHQRISISNERQLDTTNLNNLFLYHLSLEEMNNSGETLNQIIESIYNLLVNSFISLNRFEKRLLEAGYFKYHKDLYNIKGYNLRQDRFYKVAGEFPRIEAKDIRGGIGDLKYSIILSQCTSFIIPEQEVFQIINIL